MGGAAFVSVDLLTATASSLQAGLRDKLFSSVDLVRAYLDQIQCYNDYLKAVIATAPVEALVERATLLDNERLSATGQRGPMHGIPVLIKDNIATHPGLGMDTTAGSFALAGSRPKRNADIVERLLDAGAIIIGKANLSEWSYAKGYDLLCGWSAVGGQTQSAYVRGGLEPDDTLAGHSNPGGSSSGSAVAVSAGFAPVSIGSETEGSLILPAGRAALYTLRATPGVISTAGIVPISDLFDTAGPMTKNVEDLANLMDILVDPTKTNIPPGGYLGAMVKHWSELNIGVLEPSEWHYDEEILKPIPGAAEEMESEFLAAYDRIAPVAQTFHRNISLISNAKLKVDGRELVPDVLAGDLKRNLEAYLADLESSQVRSVEDIVKFNEEHADLELPAEYPDQNMLIRARDFVLDGPALDEHMAGLRRIGGTEGLEKTLNEYGIDVIIGPAESGLCELCAAAGYPIATLPVGYLAYNGRPYALAAVARAHREDVLVSVQSAWEATFPERRSPPLSENAAGAK